MISAIKRFFDDKMSSGAGPITSQKATDHAVRLATAALLVEVMKADRDVSDVEREAALSAVRDKFDLPKDEANELIALAEQEAKEATSLYQFTHMIDKGFDREQKILVIELLWRVVFADANMEAHEEALVRRIAGLIHVAHKDFIDAKIRVRDAARHEGGL